MGSTFFIKVQSKDPVRAFLVQRNPDSIYVNRFIEHKSKKILCFVGVEASLRVILCLGEEKMVYFLEFTEFAKLVTVVIL